MDGDGLISNEDLFRTMKLLVDAELSDKQLQQVVDKTFMRADLDCDSRISFDEFKAALEKANIDVSVTLSDI